MGRSGGAAMESDVTYADLKFPTHSKETAARSTGIKNDAQTQDEKKPSPKLLIAFVLVICLLFVALIAVIILYVLVSARLLQTEQRNEKLESNYTQAKKYIMCSKRSSDSDCVQFFRLLCPEGWVLNNSRCYFISIDFLSWDRSRESCRSKQADLVIISDSKEQEFISTAKSPGFYWIGMSDMEAEGAWKWVDGSILQPEKFWRCDQPDDAIEEDCATMGIEACSALQTLNNWNDDGCAKSHRYICENEATNIQREFMF